jgi:hypothetical protein
MFGRSKWQRTHTPDSRSPGARQKAVGALTSAAGVLRETAIESAKDGIKNVSEKVGKVAGAGIAVAATGLVEATGHHSSPLVAVGAAFAGAKAGGLVGKAMTAGLDRITHGRGGGPIGIVLAELSAALQTLEQVDKGVREVIDTVNKAQAYYQKVSQGANSNLLSSATSHCHRAPDHLRAGLRQVKQAGDLVTEHLVTVAKTGGR